MSLAMCAACAGVTPAHAQAQFEWNYGAVAPPPPVAFQIYKTQMMKLREDALATRKADGGTLSREHSEDIQRQIDRTTRIYHRRLAGQGF